MTVRVRFAPSPTGHLHIGGARTALYNWLFARQKKGTFILRIEDTDETRSSTESLEGIISGMRWLGLNWDEGVYSLDSEKGDYAPYFQMKRKEIYHSFAQKLLESGAAYYCFCLPDELTAMRQQALAEKRPPKYTGRCRDLSLTDQEKLRQQGRQPVVRFRTPLSGETRFADIIRGEINFQNALLDDFVILKTNGTPTYNFAVVIDDYLMKITQVIRGDDHLSNTPRQILLYQALGWQPPQFAHLSMILGTDGSRLSKRHGATSVEEFKQQGFLPEVMINYLALLGWSTEDSQQIFSPEELINKFSLERCGKSAAIFDPQKLLWMNGEYIRKQTPGQLLQKALPWVKESRLLPDQPTLAETAYLEKTISLEQEKIKLLKDVPYLVDFFFRDEPTYEEEAEKKLRGTGVGELLQELEKFLTGLADFSPPALEQGIREFTQKKGLKTGQIFHPLRAAVSGRTHGPGLFELLNLLGKEKVIQRLWKARELSK